MPRFSVIVPVFKVQGYLRECLDSVLTQSFTDLEVIAVDDRSPDGCGAILDEYARRDPRVRVLHLSENVGLGRARNAGMPYATGDFLLFLDSDDTLTPGALRAVADRLEETADPDVLVFDYARTFWWGAVRRNALAHILTEGPAAEGVFTARRYPAVLELLMVVWNKVYRRDFVERHGFAFPPGYYEDTPWTFPVLFTAGRIVTLDRVCVHYRQRRQGNNILGTTSRRHFEVHDQYGRVFAFLDAHPELAHWRATLHRRMAEHCLDILAKPHRLPAADKPEFFAVTRQLLRRHRPEAPVADHPALRTFERPYPRLVLRTKAEQARRVLGAYRAAARRRAARQAVRVWSGFHARRPLDPHLAVYSAFSHRGVLGDPAAVHEAARLLAPAIRAVWVVRPDLAERMPEGVDHVVVNSPAYRRVVNRATYFVNNVDWDADLVKRPGQIHVHTHLGSPLKHMGVDLLGHPAATYHVDVRAQLRQADRWDYSLVSSPRALRVWDRAYPCRFTALPTGAPRTDVLVRGDTLRGTAVRARLGIPHGNTVILYAPTPRDHHRGYVPRLDLAALTRGLGSGVTLLVRLHWRQAEAEARQLELRDLQQRGLLLDVTDEPSVEDLMLASDALVTDYSSLMFDYTHLDRPLVIHADDWAVFRAARGTYVDLLAEPPGHVTTSTDQLIRLFGEGTWRDERSARLRREFRARHCAYDDGHAAARVVSLVMLGQESFAAGIPEQHGARPDEVFLPGRSSG